MTKQPIRTDQAPQPGGAYSQGLRIGNTLWTAGMGPWDPVTRQVVGTTIEEQTTRTTVHSQLSGILILIDVVACIGDD